MPKVVLKNGTIFETSVEQYNRLTTMILITESLERKVQLGAHTFKLSDIETDPQKILGLSQEQLFNVVPVERKKNINMG